jgi:methionyl-tRNA synthetase
MSQKFKRYTVTSALPYANGPVHIGHLAGVYVPADIYVRYLRLKGEDVLFVGGSDEHGVPITMRAKKEGVTPQQIVDKYHKIIGDSFKEFGISFNIYSRTSAQVHYETSSQYFTDLYKKGIFEEKVTEQYFDVKAQQFLADRYIVGTCPKCGNENAYGDQCENCGSTLSPAELINPHSMLSGEKPILKQTKHWYLPLNKYESWLKEWILDGHKEWKPNVYGQCKSWIEQGLQPRAVTRDLDWGVPVPLPDAQGKVLYVWFDAPIGYISATKDYFNQVAAGNKLPKTSKGSEEKKVQAGDWEKYWKDKETKLVHFIGKDNIVFHCIIFPVMLKAHGEYILPDNVPANEFLNLEGNKISTSRNWAVWLHEYLQDFPGKADVLRYVLCGNAPETKDNDFTWKDFQARNNNELVAIFGNFINRAVVLTHNYYQGKVPALGKLETIDKEVLDKLKEYPAKIAASIEAYRFREALNTLIDLARTGNKYLADTEPWKLIKTDAERVKTILNISLQVGANLAILCEPFMPFTACKLAEQFNLGLLNWSDAGKADILKEGHQLKEAFLLFQKIEDAEIEAQVKKLLDTKAANDLASAVAAPAKPECTYDDFTKLDIRVATILEAEKVPKTKKLLKIKLDTGLDQRTVVSGIAEYYEPEKIIGQQVCLLANLAPRDIKGIESKGMILMAEDKDGKLYFVSPSKGISNGSTIA